MNWRDDAPSEVQLELVDEAIMESFPCSDPPAFTPATGVGDPHRDRLAPLPPSRRAVPRASPRARMKPRMKPRAVAVAQGAFLVVSGLWPVLHLRSFEAVTGPKRDGWLVKTVGVLLAGIGSTLLDAARVPGSKLARRLGTRTAAALGVVDLVYVARGRIAPIYLVDALLQGAFLAAWRATHARLRRT